MSIDPNKTDFDSAALHQKYLAERDKRLRPEGDKQYVPVEGDFRRYIEDPYVAPGFTREPLCDEVEVAIIGGGFSGLLAGARLRQAGIEDIRIIERGGDFGGTWYWNRYPGAACDVESYVYMPLLEEVGTVPTQKYVGTAEIWAHTQAIAQHFSLYDNACFQTEVTRVEWNEAAERWTIETNHGDKMKARFLCLGVGQVTRPKLPGISGIETLSVPSFHTCRWDFEVTGGNSEGNLTKLQDKRVGIIGAGATAIQAIPHLGEWAKQLYVFQRTPSAVDVRDNRPTDPEWAATLPLQPGWQRRRQENFDKIIAGVPQDEDLVGDSWTIVWHDLLVLANADENNGVAAREGEDLRQLADYRKMDEIRRRVDSIVEDRETAEALKPWYNLFCKRPCFHDGYLQTYNRPNVKLVDTKGMGVERIDGNRVFANGQAYEVDVLIYATGFEQNAPVYRAGGFDIVGRNALSLAEKWDYEATTFHGVMTHGFPNMFMMGVLAQAGGTVNFPLGLSEQCVHAAAVIKRAREEGVTYLEPTQEAEDGWGAEMKAKAIDREQFLIDCTPGYYNGEGETRKSFLSGLYGGGAFEYFDILRAWREGDWRRDILVAPPATADSPTPA